MEAEEKSRFTTELHDTSWIVVQKNTFTNWCNDRLKATGAKVSDLKTDLQDGLTLTQLLKVLSQSERSYRAGIVVDHDARYDDSTP